MRDALAAVERGERGLDAGDLPLVCVEVYGERFGREERAGASGGARQIFKALLQRVLHAHGEGRCLGCAVHTNVYIVSQTPNCAMKRGECTRRSAGRRICKNGSGGGRWICKVVGVPGHGVERRKSLWIGKATRSQC